MIWFEKVKESFEERSVEGKARRFAEYYHGIIDHRRRHNGEPYITHLAAVVEIVRKVDHTPQMLAAAWLHDVIEYTPATIEEVRNTFSRDVADMVEMLTGPSRVEECGRAERLRIERSRLVRATPAAKTIKLADIIDNTRIAAEVAESDQKRAKACLEKKLALLPLLRDGNPDLWFFASEAIVAACERLRSAK